jgi:hypothetical protein
MLTDILVSFNTIAGACGDSKQAYLLQNMCCGERERERERGRVRWSAQGRHISYPTMLYL